MVALAVCVDFISGVKFLMALFLKITVNSVTHHTCLLML